MATVILSPHLDDAVFSCFHLLTRPDTTVITVFAGVPPEGTSTLWDRVCGQSESAAMMKARQKENTDLLRDVGVRTYNLAYLDNQYKHQGRDLSEICNAVLAKTSPDAEFYAPLAASLLWRHPDHEALREVGKMLLQKGKKVSFYADIPYMQMPNRATEKYKQRISRRASKLLGIELTADIHELDEQDQLRKHQTMRQYKSQYKMTNLIALGTLGRNANSSREVITNVGT